MIKGISLGAKRNQKSRSKTLQWWMLKQVRWSEKKEKIQLPIDKMTQVCLVNNHHIQF